MAPLSSPPLQQLLGNIRILLNQRDPNNSFWSDQELINYLNDAVALYFLECVQANEGYFTTTADLNIVANTEAIDLPTDFFEAKNLWKKISNGFAPLYYMNTLTEGYSTQGGTANESYLPQYMFRKQQLIIRPTPNFSETAGLKIEYIQFPDTMVWGGDSLTNQISPVFKQLVGMYAVYKAKLKESMVNGGNMHSIPESNMAALYTAFKHALQRRSKGPTYVTPFNPEV